jgi:hypothetical protein
MVYSPWDAVGLHACDGANLHTFIEVGTATPNTAPICGERASERRLGRRDAHREDRILDASAVVAATGQYDAAPYCDRGYIRQPAR